MSKLEEGMQEKHYLEIQKLKEHERLAVAAALREAAAIAHDCTINETRDEKFRIEMTLLALLSDSDRSALDAHDAEVRIDAKQEVLDALKESSSLAVREVGEYLQKHLDTVRAEIRALKRGSK